jgi:hypothetical protein
MEWPKDPRLAQEPALQVLQLRLLKRQLRAMHSAAGQERLRQKANLTALGNKRGIGWVGWVEIEIRCERKWSEYVGPCRCKMFRIDLYLWVSMCVSILL